MNDESRHSGTLPGGGADSHLLPTPLATAGVGLVLAGMLPGGLDGGEGFLIGLVVGLVISLVVAITPPRKGADPSRCPTCGRELPSSQTPEEIQTADRTLLGRYHNG
jgi:hypothetical protein